MKPLQWIVLVLFCAVCVLSCSQSDSNTRNQGVSQKQKIKKPVNVHNALPLNVKYPVNNLSTEVKINLGRLLFFDPILSGDQDVACATCHHPNNGYAEYRDLSIGVNGAGFATKRKFNQPNDIPFVKRNAQTILNTAYNGISTANLYVPENAPMFWDIRTLSLENQALEPIKAFEEMRGHDFEEDDILDEVVSRLKDIPEYQALFKEVFGQDQSVNVENLGKAIAAYERTLITNNSRFDQYKRGDENAISLSEKEGFETFLEVGCGNCHNGAMFSDFKPHVLGVPTNEKLSIYDTGFKEGFAFRTASLRNLRFTAPYMHNGSLNSLELVLEFYEDIARGQSRHDSIDNTMHDPLVGELDLTIRDMAPIISFLNTLNDNSFDKTIPESVPSGLQVGGNIK